MQFSNLWPIRIPRFIICNGLEQLLRLRSRKFFIVSGEFYINIKFYIRARSKIFNRQKCPD